MQFLEFKKRILKAYLYGSYAEGRFHFGSDIDVCLVSKKFEKNKDDLEFWLWQKRREIHPLLEPIGFSPNEFTKLSLLVAEIQEKGILIY
jgi:predicted nucleotidyltransferase